MDTTIIYHHVPVPIMIEPVVQSLRGEGVIGQLLYIGLSHLYKA